MSRKIIGREKRYVEVDVRFEPDGHLRPLEIGRASCRDRV